MKKLNQNHYYFLDMFLLKSNILLKKNAFYLFTLIFEFPAFLVPSGFVGQQPVTSELLMPTPPVCKHPGPHVAMKTCR